MILKVIDRPVHAHMMSQAAGEDTPNCHPDDSTVLCTELAAPNQQILITVEKADVLPKSQMGLHLRLEKGEILQRVKWGYT